MYHCILITVSRKTTIDYGFVQYYDTETTESNRSEIDEIRMVL